MKKALNKEIDSVIVIVLIKESFQYSFQLSIHHFVQGN